MVLINDLANVSLFGSGARKPTRLVIVFTDFSSFKLQAGRISDAEIADTMDDYYQLVNRVVDQFKGRVVKFIGDAALIVFPAEKADDALRAILTLRTESDRFMIDRDWECRFGAKVHVGEVVAGDFGGRGSKRYDVMGRAVNETAMLNGDGIVLSDAMRAAVSADLLAKVKMA